jgi:sulfur-carrier protein
VTVVRIPPTLREQTQGQAALEAEGDTVRELLDDLTSRFPELRDRIYDEEALASFVNVYVEGEDIRTRDGLETPVSGGTVILLPAMAGGFLASFAGERPGNRGNVSAPS